MDFPLCIRWSLIVKRTMDNRKVSDHHAIIPTAELKGFELQELSKGERDILRLISVRLLCAGAQKHIFQETEVRVSCAGEIFQAKGKSVQEIGWKAIEAAFREQLGIKSRTDGGAENHSCCERRTDVSACYGKRIRALYNAAKAIQ